MKNIAYARVSTTDQTCENQRIILDNWFISQGLTYKYISEEESSRKTRPLKNDIMMEARRGHVSTIVVVRIDRWARSLQELVMDVNELVNRGVRFVAIENGFDFNQKNFNATNQLLLNIMSSLADFERSLLSERVKEGMARAKAEGKHIGRPTKKVMS